MGQSGLERALGELRISSSFCWSVEERNERITAAKLCAMRSEPDSLAAIAALLRVQAMASNLAAKTVAEIEEFLITGDATAAAQLVHAAMVRQKRCTTTSAAKSSHVGTEWS
jgi:hypothetical protein